MNKWQYVYQACILFALICVVGLVANYLGAAPSSAETTQPAATDAAAPAAPAKEATKAAPTYVGSDTCIGCHPEIGDQLHKDFHGLAMSALESKKKGYLCEGCHGPGSQHADDPSVETGAPLKQHAASGDGCMSCHDTKLSPAQWQRTEHHHAGINCIQCHGQVIDPHLAPTAKVKQKAADGTTSLVDNLQPHADIQRKPAADVCLTCHSNVRGEISLPYHHPIKEGQVTCSDCHDPHQPMTDKVKDEVCLNCHAQERGPFRFAHAAISAGHLSDACLDCHRPHGSPNQKLLKFSNRGLCLQCHADKALHFPGRTCWECHTEVHGSNTSPLFFGE